MSGFAKILNNPRGIALLITVTIITFLITGAIELNRKVRSAVIAAGTTRDWVRLSQMAASGVNTAMAILVRDKRTSQFDSVQEDWADPVKIAEIVTEIPFNEGGVQVRISDERGKIQINALVQYPAANQFNKAQQMLWIQALNYLIPLYELDDDISATSIINAIKDWIDANDDDAISGLNGAESGYYESLDPPYVCRNGPIPHLTDLLMIKGVTPELYYGTNNIPGISEFTTIHGLELTDAKGVAYDGKININTAPLEVLAALLPLGSQELAGEMDNYRKEILDDRFVNDLSQPTWYKNVPGLSDVTIDPNLITISSDIFRIRSVATLHDLSLTTSVVVLRKRDTKTGRWQCKVLQWKTD